MVADLVGWANGYSVAVAITLLVATALWLAYVAVEPYLRRRIPELLIAWARLLEGRWRDPRIGRDALIGAIVGVVLALLSHIVNGLSTWFAFPGQTTIPSVLVAGGNANPLAYLLSEPLQAVGRALTIMSVYFVARLVFRKPAVAAVFLGVIELLLNLGGENVALELPAAVLGAVAVVWLVARVGLLAAVTMWTYRLLLINVAPSFDFSSWYAVYTMPALVALLALTLYAFYISVGSQPLFGAATLED